MSKVELFSCIVLGLYLNLFVGRVVALLIDNRHRDLQFWLRQAPHWTGRVLVLEFWPILFFSVHNRWRSK